jgi:hypothetical protein
LAGTAAAASDQWRRHAEDLRAEFGLDLADDLLSQASTMPKILHQRRFALMTGSRR